MPSIPNISFPFVATTVMVHRRNTNQASNLFAVQVAEFWQLIEPGVSQYLAHSFNAGELIDSLLSLWDVGNKFIELLINAVNFSGYLFENVEGKRPRGESDDLDGDRRPGQRDGAAAHQDAAASRLQMSVGGYL